jgi:hypothetical protein
MTDILSIQEVRGQHSGALIGFELTTHPGGEKLLVWADQRGMPAFAWAMRLCRATARRWRLASARRCAWTPNVESSGPPR